MDLSPFSLKSAEETNSYSITIPGMDY